MTPGLQRLCNLIIGCVCCAISFPRIGFKPQRLALGLRWLPIPPNQAELDAETGSWFHLKKDLWVNSVRADSEWWGKFLSFVICSLVIIVICLVVIC